jgi:hypothetical protein
MLKVSFPLFILYRYKPLPPPLERYIGGTYYYRAGLFGSKFGLFMKIFPSIHVCQKTQSMRQSLQLNVFCLLLNFLSGLSRYFFRFKKCLAVNMKKEGKIVAFHAYSAYTFMYHICLIEKITVPCQIQGKKLQGFQFSLIKVERKSGTQ